MSEIDNFHIFGPHGLNAMAMIFADIFRCKYPDEMVKMARLWPNLSKGNSLRFLKEGLHYQLTVKWNISIFKDLNGAKTL